MQFHGLVEFGNRLVTVVLVIAVAAAFLAAVFRAPRRRDLMWLSGGLVVGVLAQAVLGGIVVYTKLNPYVVMVHFFATMLLLVDAVVLVHRSTRWTTRPDRAACWCPGRSSASTTASWRCWPSSSPPGTATTGAGPHAGDASGQQVAKRIPVVAARHGGAALEPGPAPRSASPSAWWSRCTWATCPSGCAARAASCSPCMVAQAAVGYTQYFTHLPALLVEVHLLGATVLVIGAVQTFLACTYHAPEARARSARPRRIGAGHPRRRPLGSTAPVRRHGPAPIV